jgi:lysophospholipase L1-like esterase
MSAMTFSRSRLYLTHKPFASPDYNVDDNGFRSVDGVRDVFAGYDPKKTNIFAFGGSTTFGALVKDQETWPRILERQLRKTNPNVDVYNLGIAGFSSLEEMHLLVDVLAQGRVPRIAIFFDGAGNDSCPEPRDRSAAFRQFEDGEVIRLIQMSNIVKLMRRAMDKWAAISNSSSSSKPPVDFDRCAEHYSARATLAARLLEAYGAKAFFILQPSGLTIPNYATYRFWAYSNQTVQDASIYRQLYDAYASRSNAVATIVDMRSILDEAAAKRDDVFVDPSHPAAVGHAIIAEHILELLKPSLAERSSASNR